MSVMRHSTDMKLVPDKMKASFQQRQKVVQDSARASTVLNHFIRFLDTPDLVRPKSNYWQLCAGFVCSLLGCLLMLYFVLKIDQDLSVW